MVVATDLLSLNPSERQGWWKEPRDADLLVGTFRNPNGLLVRECVEVPASNLDMVALRRESTYLKQHVIIVRFANNISPSVDHRSWIRELKDLVNAKTSLHRGAGGRFHFIKLDTIEMVCQVLNLSPCRFKVGTAIFQ